MADFPASPEAFTTAWLEASLAAPAGSLRGFTAAPVGTGQVADSHRVTLDWAGPRGPASVIAKTPSHDAQSRETAVNGRLYAREVNWYRGLASRSAVRRPGVYRSEIDDEGGRFVLLLEDCAPARQGDQLMGVDPDQIGVALREAAALHAPFVGDAGLFDHDWLTYDRAHRAGRIEHYAAFWPAFRERYAGRLDPAIFEMGDAFAARFERYVDHDPAVFTVTHNDFRIDNILFGGLDGRAVILDWQTLSIGHPMADVAYLIGGSLADPAVRRAHEADLVSDYAAALAARGASLDEEALWTAYRRNAFSGFVMAVISCMLVKRTDRGDEMFAVMAERPARQVLDLDSLALL